MTAGIFDVESESKRACLQMRVANLELLLCELLLKNELMRQERQSLMNMLSEIISASNSDPADQRGLWPNDQV